MWNLSLVYPTAWTLFAGRCNSGDSHHATAFHYAISSKATNAKDARTMCPSGYTLAKPKSLLEARAAWKFAAGSAPANPRSSCFNYTFGTVPMNGIASSTATTESDAWTCQKRCQDYNANATSGNATRCAYFNFVPAANGNFGTCSLTTSAAIYVNEVNQVISGPPTCTDLSQGCTTLTQGQTPISGIERQGRTVTASWIHCQARCAALSVNQTNMYKPWWNSSWDLSFNGDFTTLTNSAGENCTNTTAFPNHCSFTSACTYFSWWPDGGCYVTANTHYFWGVRNASLTIQSTAKGTGATVVTGPATCVDYNDTDPSIVGRTTYPDANGNEIPFSGVSDSAVRFCSDVSVRRVFTHASFSAWDYSGKHMASGFPQWYLSLARCSLRHFENDMDLG